MIEDKSVNGTLNNQVDLEADTTPIMKIGTVISTDWNTITNKPTDLVEDSKYIHTDNNYSDLDKNKLDTISNYDDTKIKADIELLNNLKADKTDIPTKTSELTNNSGYLTSHQDISGKQDTLTAGTNITIENNVISAVGGGTSYDDTKIKADVKALQDTKVDKVVGKDLFSGSYIDLKDKPTLFDGNYNNLTNKPTIPVVPTNISAFTNDKGYLTTHQSLDNYYDKSEIDTKIGDIETLLGGI